MEYGGKMEHRVFWKKACLVWAYFHVIWFLSSASSISYIEIKLAIDHVFEYLTKFHPFDKSINSCFDSNCFDKFSSTCRTSIDISPSIFELERRPKAQNIGDANGYLSGIFNFRYNFRWKSLSRAQNGGHFENFEILNTASIWPQIWKDRPKLCHKKFFVVMTSSMTSQGGLKVSLYIHV